MAMIQMLQNTEEIFESSSEKSDIDPSESSEDEEFFRQIRCADEVFESR